jgi:hypothetical protein
VSINAIKHKHTVRGRGPMDKAPDYGSGDWGRHTRLPLPRGQPTQPQRLSVVHRSCAAILTMLAASHRRPRFQRVQPIPHTTHKTRHAVHNVAVVRQQRARATHHRHHTPVRRQQHETTTDRLRVVRQRHLHGARGCVLVQVDPATRRDSAAQRYLSCPARTAAATFRRRSQLRGRNRTAFHQLRQRCGLIQLLSSMSRSSGVSSGHSLSSLKKKTYFPLHAPIRA